MTFSMRNFIRQGLLDAVGKMGDYWIILNAAGWLEKGVLTEEDLPEIQAAIDAKNLTEPDTQADSGSTETEEAVPGEETEEKEASQ